MYGYIDNIHLYTYRAGWWHKDSWDPPWKAAVMALTYKPKGRNLKHEMSEECQHKVFN